LGFSGKICSSRERKYMKTEEKKQTGYRCDKCGRGVDYGHNVSHAKNRTRRLRLPNLHRASVLVDGKKVKMRLCTKCLRAADRPKREEKKVEAK